MSRNGPEIAVGDRTEVVIAGFDDTLRAEQAARATDLWRSANRTLPIGPIIVVGRTVSGSVAVNARGVVRPRAGARVGFLIGSVVAGLPASGIAGFLAWLLGSVLTALLSLVGLIGGATATIITLAIAVGGAVVGGLAVGLLGGLVGAGIGAVVGLIHSRTRGFTRSQMGALAADVAAGDAIVAVSAGVMTAPLVTDELLRLGGTPRPTHALSGAARTIDAKASEETDVAAS